MIKVEITGHDDAPNKTLEIPKAAAMGSILFKDAMDMDPKFADGTAPYPIDTLKDGVGTEFPVEPTIMQNIIDYMIQHQGKESKALEKPLPYDNIEELVDKWDNNFLKNTVGDDTQDLIKYAIISDYLKIKPLCEIVCAKLGLMLRKCKTVEEIRTLMRIENDFTPEEEAEHKAKWGWIDELKD